MAGRLEWLTTERATRDRLPVKFFVSYIYFYFFFFGYPWGVWARGVTRYLVIEVLMQKTLFHHLVEGYTSTSPVNIFNGSLLYM
jgi:hypothetical protein